MPRATRDKKAYPKFARRGDQLVKIGWSKKEKKEYQHKAPKQVAEILAAVLARTGGAARILATDDLFPLHDRDGGELPAYQAYVCLAWFKAEGFVEQHGRQGYSVPDSQNLPQAIQAAWQELDSI